MKPEVPYSGQAMTALQEAELPFGFIELLASHGLTRL